METSEWNRRFNLLERNYKLTRHSTLFETFQIISGIISLFMFAPKSCSNQQMRFLQRHWLILIFLPLAMAFFSFALFCETQGQDPGSTSVPPVMQSQPDANDNSTGSKTNTTAKNSETAVPKEADASDDSDKQAAADDDANEDIAPDPAEILDIIRKSYAKRRGEDASQDALILSQSSSFIFLNRKKAIQNYILIHYIFYRNY